ncbi:MAG: hypothetical protein WC858_06180 [Parcubacteria group bacterium]|jgi:hypothetical protein
MEILKPKALEETNGIENHPEVIEMKKNIIQRARVLMDQNSELAPKVLRADWNRNLKEDTLAELRNCRIATKNVTEGFNGRLH